MVNNKVTPSTVGNNSNLKNAHVWEVKSPLPLHPGGKGHHFVPAQLTPTTRRRRISVEVHKLKSLFGSIAESSAENINPLSETEICYVRILEHGTFHAADFVDKVLDPIAHKMKGDAKKATKGTVNFFTGTLRKKRTDNDSDDESVGDGSIMNSFREASIASSTGAAGGDQDEPFEGWLPKYKVPLRMFSIVEKKKRSVIVAFESKGHSTIREFIFDCESALDEFCSIVEENKNLLDSRLKARVKLAMGSIKVEKGEELTLLFDICSGKELPSGDIGKKSDPYISVRFNGKRIHKTGYITNTADPIWTLRKGSLFTWKVKAIDLFQAEEGLIFEVKDYDSIGSNESLGAFNVNASTLYKWDGERREFALKPLLGQRDFDQGKISLRVRRATAHDIKFLQDFEAKEKNTAKTALPLPTITAGTTLKSIMKINSKKEREGPDKGKTKYFVRPGPDPKRREVTSWLTKEKIEEESKTQSCSWMDVGSGTLGKIFVEILGCDNLPNMDTFGVLGNKTDAFVSLVYEDCLARTDIINDCLSPRWMPWSQRAFIFNMMHTSSQLFLAVFDSDTTPMSRHDLVGRVSVNLSNFRRNTVYLLEYNLYKTAKFGLREAKFGTIKLRLRLEPEDERTRMISNFRLPQSVYVNVVKKKDFEVVRGTVEGGIDSKKYSLGTLNAHCGELMDYLTICYALEDAFISLVLWRGYSIINLPMPSFSTPSIKWISATFPVHSLVAFIGCTCLVENPDFLPSFFFGCIGWMLLATIEGRSHHPNPWNRSKTFSHFLTALFFGKDIVAPQLIAAHENEDGVMDTETFWAKRLRLNEEKAKQRALQYAEESEQYMKDLKEIGDTNEDLDAPTVGGISFDPTRAYLFPIHHYLRATCIFLRVSKNILVWEESYISFWIASACFVLSFAVFFVPWGFLIQWTLRIIVWCTLGPWMKLADIYYFSRLEEETDEQKKHRMGQLELERQRRLEKQKLEAQLVREKSTKLKDFKQYMFGEHICKVNILKKDRYYDLPLPTSSSVKFNPKSQSLGELAMQEAGYRRHRVDGQQLDGEMIPMRHGNPATEAPTGKPTKKTDLLEKGSPAVLYNGNDSYSAAAIKVGSILVGAGAITWFGVPLFVYLVRLVMPE